MLRRPGDIGQSHRCAVRLGLCFVDRSHADVIRAVPVRRVRHVGGGGAAADDPLWPENPAGEVDGEVALSGVHAIGIGEGGDVRAVVQDEEGSGFAAEFAHGEGGVVKAGVFPFLFAELDDVRASREGFACDGGNVCAGEALGDEDIQARVAETLQAGLIREKARLDGIEAVAQRLAFQAEIRREEFAVFLQHAEGFLQTLAGGARHGGGGVAGFLTGGREGGADIAGGVAVAFGGLGKEGADVAVDGGEVMPDRFERGRKRGDFQHKPGVFLHDTCPFRRAVEVGIEEAGKAGLHGRHPSAGCAGKQDRDVCGLSGCGVKYMDWRAGRQVGGEESGNRGMDDDNAPERLMD